MRTGASALKAGTTAVLAGGSIYWLVIIEPNATDTWSPIAFGNIPTYSLAGYTVWTSRLTDISDIDQSIDIITDSVAKLPEVDFTLLNMDNAIDARLYMGRKVQVRMGYGTTMSIATSDIFAYMTIYNVVSENKRVKFKAQGNMKMWDKEIGTKVPEDVDDQFKGKIYPITYGNWTDSFSYAPTILNKRILKYPDLIIDTMPVLSSAPILYCYDNQAKRNYRLNQSFDINANHNRLSYFNATAATLHQAIGELDETLWIDNYSSIIFDTSTIGSPIPPVIQIDEEQIYIGPGSPYAIPVERGYNNTKKQPHAYGSIIKQINPDAGRFRFKISDIIYSVNKGINRNSSGWSIYGLWYIKGVGGKFQYLFDDDLTNFVQYDGKIETTLDKTAYIELPLVFEKISLDAEVLNQYVIAKAETDVIYKFGNGTTDKLLCIIKFSDDANGFLGYSYFNILETWTNHSESKLFDNISGSDNETDIEITNNAQYTNIKMDNIKNLNDKRYTIVLEINNDSNCYGDFVFKLYKFGLRFDALIDPLMVKVYSRHLGRFNDGTRFNGSIGDLIENPSSVIEDLCVASVPGMSSANLDEASFDAFYTARANWKLAATIFSGE